MKVFCKIFGHRWHTVVLEPKACLVCLRCREHQESRLVGFENYPAEQKELTQLRNVVARARELIEEGHHSTSGPCETCKAFIVLINSVPAPSSSAPTPETERDV